MTLVPVGVIVIGFKPPLTSSPRGPAQPPLRVRVGEYHVVEFGLTQLSMDAEREPAYMYTDPGHLSG